MNKRFEGRQDERVCTENNEMNCASLTLSNKERAYFQIRCHKMQIQKINLKTKKKKKVNMNNHYQKMQIQNSFEIRKTKQDNEIVKG